jgi:hypothetical protein
VNNEISDLVLLEFRVDRFWLNGRLTLGTKSYCVCGGRIATAATYRSRGVMRIGYAFTNAPSAQLDEA